MVHWRGLHVGGGRRRLAPVGTEGLLHWGRLAVRPSAAVLAVGGPVVGRAVVGPAAVLLVRVAAAIAAAVGGPDSPLLPALLGVRLRAGRRGEADGLRLPPGPPLRGLLGVLGVNSIAFEFSGHFSGAFSGALSGPFLLLTLFN